MYLNIMIMNNNNCYDIIYSYDHLSMIMFIINYCILLSILCGFIIFIIIYYYKKYQNKKNTEDNIELIVS
jgi:hypothetical protein